MMLTADFFDHDALEVAKALVGKVIHVRHDKVWLKALIIETEAYYKEEKGSHASLGYTEKRKALFMPPGTIYMYYARGGDSLNISCQGEGNAVLIKSAVPYDRGRNAQEMIEVMQTLNPRKDGERREAMRLCSGQTLLCRSLRVKVPEWDQKTFDPRRFFIKDVGYRPEKLIQAPRLGIPPSRDAHLPYRFIDYRYTLSCTKNPLRKRVNNQESDYSLINL